ncbi:MAG: hypothetical protein ACD_17C00315G0002 [uncultured bacterium]|nr:MAG: hypothetical protein ACD_17C00315G0002 [uncultured bacterium]
MSFWIQPPHKNCLLKEMISIQGAQIVIAFSPDPKMPVKRFPLGILPFPSEAKHALFFDPRLILDWEHTSSKVFFLVFGLTHSVYIENKQDPNTHYLKAFHYSFGDLLKSQTHPLIS